MQYLKPPKSIAWPDNHNLAVMTKGYKEMCIIPNQAAL